MPRILVALTVVLLPAFAHAGDGRIEISQTVAEAGGVNGDFGADPPGFPVVITQPGSYVLTSDLTVGADLSGITVSLASDRETTLDLNGFTIEGPVVCGGGGCAGAALGSGIEVFAAPGIVTIRNGGVQGFGVDGVHGITTPGVRVESIRAAHNGDDGIEVASGLDEGSVVVGCTADSNGGGGILSDLVRGSMALDNGSTGIRGYTVEGSTSRRNAGAGINALIVRDSVVDVVDAATPGINCSFGDDCLIERNSVEPGEDGTTGISIVRGIVRGNQVRVETGTGIQAGNGSIVEDNFVETTTALALGNPVGITCANGCRVTGNAVRGAIPNSSTGIGVGTGALVTDNTVTELTDGGILAGDGSTLQGNVVREVVAAGLSCGESCTIAGNSVHRATDGIQCGGNCRIHGNTVEESVIRGILTGDGAVVSDNVSNGATGGSTIGNGIEAGTGSTLRGNTCRVNEADGIQVGSGGLVYGNTLQANEQYGIDFTGTQGGYRENVVAGNVVGTVDGTAVNLGDNACNGSTTCP